MMKRCLLLGALCLTLAGKSEDSTDSQQKKAAWVALWQDAYAGINEVQFDPERMSANVAVDPSTGDAFLSMWNCGVWKSSDGGKTFARIDGGLIAGGGCGPITGYSFYVSPNGGKLATFNMNNGPGASGCSLDGGKTWEPFVAVGRNWDFGAMDFDSKTIFAARHEDEGLHVSFDGGKTFAQLARQRSGVTGLGALGKVLLIGTQGAIERSEDEGKTWTKIADTGPVGPVVTFKEKAWWLGRHHVLVSADAGKTWTEQGEHLPPMATLGPFFGKDENHIVVAGNRGIFETTDGCKTWKLAVALPKDLLSEGAVLSAAYDPVHDVFYLTSTARPVLKYTRSTNPDYVSAALPTDETPADNRVGPRLAFVGSAKAKVRCVVANGADLSGEYLYLGGEDGLIVFKRNRKTGELTFLQQVLEERCGGYAIRCANGHLYGVTPHDGYRRMKWHGLAWFDIDPQDGAPVRKGVVDCPASRQMIFGPGGKDLYLKSVGGKQDKIFWYHLDADGKPAKSGEVSGKGIGSSRHNDYPGILIISPDAKHLYSVSADDYAIACIERKASGELAWHSASGLEAVTPGKHDNAGFLWTSLGISPDGKYVYASVRQGKPTENFYAIFKRDPESGDLTFQEKFSGEQDPLANLKGWNMTFAPSGSGGYMGNFAGAFVTFKYDAQSGRLSAPLLIKETLNNGTSHMVLDGENGLLYVGGREYGYDRFFSFKLQEAQHNP